MFLLITSLSYFVACCESKLFDFSEEFRLLCDKIRNEKIHFVYEFAKSGNDFSDLLV